VSHRLRRKSSMEKVYITKVLKGKEPTHSIGMLDTAAKKLYIPFVSKKGLPIIDVVDVDYLTAIEDGYRCEVIVVDVNGNHYMNVYYANLLNK
jgi:hypothetical protein